MLKISDAIMNFDKIVLLEKKTMTKGPSLNALKISRWQRWIILTMGTSFGFGYTSGISRATGALLGVGFLALITLVRDVGYHKYLLLVAFLVSCILTILWAFSIIRIIDIIKIHPARQLEKLSGCAGILADDLCSSLYTARFLYVVSEYYPQYFGS